MPRLVLKQTADLRHERHAEEIATLLATGGYEISVPDAHAAWEAYSESMCAGWLTHSDDPDEVFSAFAPYVELATV